MLRRNTHHENDVEPVCIHYNYSKYDCNFDDWLDNNCSVHFEYKRNIKIFCQDYVGDHSIFYGDFYKANQVIAVDRTMYAPKFKRKNSLIFLSSEVTKEKQNYNVVVEFCEFKQPKIIKNNCICDIGVSGDTVKDKDAKLMTEYFPKRYK